MDIRAIDAKDGKPPRIMEKLWDWDWYPRKNHNEGT